MAVLSTKNVQQFGYGYSLLLQFLDQRADTSTPVNGGSDTWRVLIVKPDGTVIDKTTGLTFPDNSVAAIAVPIAALDLNQRGTYQYQIIRTTGGASIRSDVETFDVAPSLPDGMLVSPPTSNKEGFVPAYDATGALTESPLRITGANLFLNGSTVPLGTGDMTQAVYDPLAVHGDAFDRANHHGSINADQVASGTTNKVYTATEKTKLASIASNATANSADATLLNRTNHTGTQLAATISDFASAASAVSPAETPTSLGTLIVGANSKAAPDDADAFLITDSTASNVGKRLTYLALKTAFGSVFQTASSALTAWAGKAIPTGFVVGTNDIQILSNKKHIKRVAATSSASSITPNLDNFDVYVLTAQAVAFTLNNHGGTPSDGDIFEVRITPTGAVSLSFGTDYTSRGATLPTATISGKKLRILFEWDAATSKFDAVSVIQES